MKKEKPLKVATKKVTVTIPACTKLDQSIIDKMSPMVESGTPITTVCDILNIGRSTYYRWLEQGEQDLDSGTESVHAAFAAAVKKAEGLFLERMAQKVVNAADNARLDQWACPMTVLERRDPQNWGRKQHTEVSGQVGIGIAGIIAMAQEYNPAKDTLELEG